MTSVSVPLNDLCECGSSTWIAESNSSTGEGAPLENLRCAVCELPKTLGGETQTAVPTRPRIAAPEAHIRAVEDDNARREAAGPTVPTEPHTVTVTMAGNEVTDTTGPPAQTADAPPQVAAKPAKRAKP